MDIEQFQQICLRLPFVEETLPFDEDTLVFKVKGKIFALTSLSAYPFSLNLKCDPERAIELRELYPEAILPGYHMNKQHWNTIIPSMAALPKNLLRDLLLHSYHLVVAKLPKAERLEVLQALAEQNLS